MHQNAPSGLPACTALPHEKLLCAWCFHMPGGVCRDLRESGHGARFSRVLRHLGLISQNLNSQRALGSYVKFLICLEQLSSCFPKSPRSWCCWIAEVCFFCWHWTPVPLSNWTPLCWLVSAGWFLEQEAATSVFPSSFQTNIYVLPQLLDFFCIFLMHWDYTEPEGLCHGFPCHTGSCMVR